MRKPRTPEFTRTVTVNGVAVDVGSNVSDQEVKKWFKKSQRVLDPDYVIIATWCDVRTFIGPFPTKQGAQAWLKQNRKTINRIGDIDTEIEQVQSPEQGAREFQQILKDAEDFEATNIREDYGSKGKDR